MLGEVKSRQQKSLFFLFTCNEEQMSKGIINLDSAKASQDKVIPTKLCKLKNRTFALP